MSHKTLSHKLALFKAVLKLIRCLVIACHAEGREKQVTTWNLGCKREQGPAPRAALDLWTVGKGFTWGNQLTWATWRWRHHPGWPFHLFSWGHLPAGRQNRHHKEKQRARTTQLEIEPTTTTWTSTQHHKSKQPYCFTKLVLLFHIYSSALFCWTHEVKVQFHIYFHWLLSEGLGSLGEWAGDSCTAAAQLPWSQNCKVEALRKWQAPHRLQPKTPFTWVQTKIFSPTEGLKMRRNSPVITPSLSANLLPFLIREPDSWLGVCLVAQATDENQRAQARAPAVAGTHAQICCPHVLGWVWAMSILLLSDVPVSGGLQWSAIHACLNQSLQPLIFYLPSMLSLISLLPWVPGSVMLHNRMRHLFCNRIGSPSSQMRVIGPFTYHIINTTHIFFISFSSCCLLLEIGLIRTSESWRQQ